MILESESNFFKMNPLYPKLDGLKSFSEPMVNVEIRFIKSSSNELGRIQVGFGFPEYMSSSTLVLEWIAFDLQPVLSNSVHP